MYIPNQFAETRPEVIHELLASHLFCSLVTAGSDGMFASHLPMIFDPARGTRGVLRGHLARANPHSKLNHTQGLAIFAGPEGYVSPSFYPSKQQHGKVVPTWNYQVVHVRGPIRFTDDAAFLRRIVEDLTVLMESHRAHPWKVSDAPEDYLEKLLSAIVGVELEIQDIQAKSKLSQNRSAEDFKGVVDGLKTSPDPRAGELARVMASIS